MNTFIFTEIVNAGPIGKVMLQSFVAHHREKIHVYGTNTDFEELGDMRFHQQIQLINIDQDEEIAAAYKKGHLGTAMIFNRAWWNAGVQNVIHIDSDVYFKKESLSLIENAFKEGYDIVGSRRCYANNPGQAPVHPGAPDTISTYFTGWKKDTLTTRYSQDELIRMWQGAYNPLAFPVLDFGDPICFVMLNNGAKIKFISSNLIGGQDENGSKVNDYRSNMHFDCGSHLVHLGGVGSGYAFHHKRSNPETGYAQWSLGRWSIFSKLFYNQDTGYSAPTVINHQHRWVDGNYNEDILFHAKKEIFEE